MHNIKLHGLYEASEKYIDPYLKGVLLNSNESLMCGKSKIHSSDMPMISEYAKEWGVNKYTFAEHVGDMAQVVGKQAVDKELMQNVHNLMLTCR